MLANPARTRPYFNDELAWAQHEQVLPARLCGS
jgi:hypothetical protein